MITTEVGAILRAAHHAKDGDRHSHVWRVWAVFPWADGHRDALVLQARLEGVLSAWQRKTLPDEIAWSEALVEAIARLLGDAIEVRAERHDEMITARWRA